MQNHNDFVPLPYAGITQNQVPRVNRRSSFSAFAPLVATMQLFISYCSITKPPKQSAAQKDHLVFNYFFRAAQGLADVYMPLQSSAALAFY